jgi:hypothetical protein
MFISNGHKQKIGGGNVFLVDFLLSMFLMEARSRA